VVARQRLDPFASELAADEGAFDRLRASLDPAWIEEALSATGTASIRRRRLPAEQVLWLVLGMALYRRLPIDEIVASLDLALPGVRGVRVAPSAVAQARARLGDEPLRWLFERTAAKWAHESARRHEWRGLAVYGVDGTTARVPDSDENRLHFGQSGSCRGMSGYPLARIVTLMTLRSHLLAGASFGPYADEHTYAKDLWPLIPANSLAIVDRNFFAATILIPLVREADNRHWLTRAKTNHTWHSVKRMGAGDELVEMEVSRSARHKDPSLPKRWIVRAIEYKRPGFQPQVLLTSLLDAEEYPAREIIALYHERWEMELGYDEVKTDLLDRQETIRSRKPVGVMQELWAIGLVYNLVRLEMEHVADEAGVAPTRISFTMALRLIQDEWKWAAVSTPGTIPLHLRRLREDLMRFVLPPRRSTRSFPRAVKLKMSNYARKRPKPLRARKQRGGAAR
jgi:hypothetical protein